MQRTERHTMILTIPAVVAVIGAIVYAVTEGKASELGRLAYGCGLLAVLLHRFWR